MSQSVQGILSIAARIAIGRSFWVLVLSMDRTADMHLPDIFLYGRARYLHLAWQNCRTGNKSDNNCQT